jgi:hypothetical protein
MKHVAARLDLKTYQSLRLAVIQRNSSIQNAVVEAIQQWLAMQQEEAPPDRRARIRSAKGLFATRHPERILSEELLAERRIEARDE